MNNANEPEKLDDIPEWEVDSAGSYYCPECKWYGPEHSKHCKWHGTELKTPKGGERWQIYISK